MDVPKILHQRISKHYIVLSFSHLIIHNNRNENDNVMIIRFICICNCFEIQLIEFIIISYYEIYNILLLFHYKYVYCTLELQ